MFFLHVECHPYYQQVALKNRIAPYGTKIECWYPTGYADVGPLNEPLHKNKLKSWATGGMDYLWHCKIAT